MAQENWSEKTECQAPPEVPVFCTNNCGYVGSPATMNLCTKCYTDLVHPNAPSKSIIEVAAIHSGETGLAHEEAEIAVSLLIPQTPKANNKAEKCLQERRPSLTSNRCLCCRKRVGLSGFMCRCGDLFCSLHRYAEKHNCSFDYKAAGRDAIAKANPVIKADKIRRI